mmetsp:Transcript_2621/g.8081  ORF Transcript_2621/g.8081 Transcript_2621/m.8081 type:complete len:260 (+) Transcript_2621:1096-1875(+)
MVPGRACGVGDGCAQLDNVQRGGRQELQCVRLLHVIALVPDAVHSCQHGDPPVQHRRAGVFHRMPDVCPDHILIVSRLHYCLDHPAPEAHHGDWQAAARPQVILEQEQGVWLPEQGGLEIFEAAPLQPPDAVTCGAGRAAEAAAAPPQGRPEPGAVRPVCNPRPLLLPLHGHLLRRPCGGVQLSRHREVFDLQRGALLRGQDGRDDVLYRLGFPEVRARPGSLQPDRQHWFLAGGACVVGEVGACCHADCGHHGGAYRA